MEQAYVLTGELRDGRSVVLDETVPLAPGKVQVTVRPIPRPPNAADHPATPDGVLETIWARQKARGHVPPTVAEVARRVAAERDSWD